jgi:hypothetical protein
LDITNPSFIDHYVAAAVNMESEAPVRDLVGTKIRLQLSPACDDESLSDEESLNDDLLQESEGACLDCELGKKKSSGSTFAFNSVLGHVGFRHRKEVNPAC